MLRMRLQMFTNLTCQKWQVHRNLHENVRTITRFCVHTSCRTCRQSATLRSPWTLRRTHWRLCWDRGQSHKPSQTTAIWLPVASRVVVQTEYSCPGTCAAMHHNAAHISRPLQPSLFRWEVKMLCAEWVSRGLMSQLTLYRSFQGRFYRPDDPTNSVKALKETSRPLR